MWNEFSLTWWLKVLWCWDWVKQMMRSYKQWKVLHTPFSVNQLIYSNYNSRTFSFFNSLFLLRTFCLIYSLAEVSIVSYRYITYFKRSTLCCTVVYMYILKGRQGCRYCKDGLVNVAALSSPGTFQCYNSFLFNFLPCNWSVWRGITLAEKRS